MAPSLPNDQAVVVVDWKRCPVLSFQGANSEGVLAAHATYTDHQGTCVVAIKRFNVVYRNETAIREAQIAKLLYEYHRVGQGHENVLNCLGWSRSHDRNSFYLYSPLLPRGNLHHYLEWRTTNQMALSKGELATIAWSLLPGLFYLARTLGLSANEVLPVNILIESDYRLVISDHGAASYFPDESGQLKQHALEDVGKTLVMSGARFVADAEVNDFVARCKWTGGSDPLGNAPMPKPASLQHPTLATELHRPIDHHLDGHDHLIFPVPVQQQKYWSIWFCHYIEQLLGHRFMKTPRLPLAGGPPLLEPFNPNFRAAPSEDW